MAKKTLIIFLIVLVVMPFLTSVAVYANGSIVDRDPDSILSPGSDSSDSDNIWEKEDAQAEDFWGDVEPDNGMLTKLFIWLVQEIMHGFNRIFGLHDPVTLFFNVSPEDVYSDYSGTASFFTGQDKEGFIEARKERLDRNLYVNPKEGFLFMFNENEKSTILGVMNTLEKFLQIPYVVAVTMVGFFIFMKGTSSDEKATGKTFLMGILLYPVMIKFFPYLFEPLFWLNDMIVRAMGSALLNPNIANPGKAVLTRPFVTILIDSGTGLGSLSAALATLVLFVMTGILNFQYFVRRFMLALLIMMFPIVAFMQIFPGTRETFRLWWSEFTANLFLQAAHAMVYVMFVGYVYNAKLPFIPIVAMLTTLSTMSTFVRNLMGCRPGSGVSGMVGGMMGISALMGATRVANSIMGGLGQRGRYSVEEPSYGGGRGVSYSGATEGVDMGEVAADTSVEGVGDGGIGVGAAEFTDEDIGVSTGSSAMGSTAVGEAGTTLSGASSSANLSQTGQAWGLKPRMENVNWKASLGKGVAGAAMTLGVGAGAIVGGAAMGPAGIGMGAYAASMGIKPIAHAGDRLLGIYGNFQARNEVIEDTMKRRGIDRGEATVFAATGVQATPEEVQYDDALRQQYTNFTNVTGFASLHQPPKPELPEEEVEKIRNLAAQEREVFMEQNPGAGIVAANQHILENVIRPSLETYKAESTPTETSTFRPMEGHQITIDEYLEPRQLTTDDFVNSIDDVMNINPSTDGVGDETISGTISGVGSGMPNINHLDNVTSTKNVVDNEEKINDTSDIF